MHIITIAPETQTNINTVKLAIRKELQAIARRQDSRTRGTIQAECELACGIVAKATYSIIGNVTVRFYTASNIRYTEVEADNFLMDYSKKSVVNAPETTGFIKLEPQTVVSHGTAYFELDSTVIAIHKANRAINYLRTLYAVMLPGTERQGVLSAINLIDRAQWHIDGLKVNPSQHADIIGGVDY